MIPFVRHLPLADSPGRRVAASPRRVPIAPNFVRSTSFTVSRSGNTSIVTVGALLAGAVFYWWYLDGQCLGMTTGPTKTLLLAPGDQGQLEVLQTTDPTFDPAANAPVGYFSTRVLEFVRSIDPAIDRYRIEQQKAGGSWTVLGFVRDRPGQWSYRFTTKRLDDLTAYAWRVVPLDLAGNAGSAVSLGGETIVRVPDAPDFTATFDAVHDQVNFQAA